jgi:hypothetical protein
VQLFRARFKILSQPSRRIRFPFPLGRGLGLVKQVIDHTFFCVIPTLVYEAEDPNFECVTIRVQR